MVIRIVASIFLSFWLKFKRLILSPFFPTKYLYTVKTLQEYAGLQRPSPEELTLFFYFIILLWKISWYSSFSETRVFRGLTAEAGWKTDKSDRRFWFERHLDVNDLTENHRIFLTYLTKIQVKWGFGRN